MALISGIAAAAGLGLQFYGQRKAAKAQKKASRKAEEYYAWQQIKAEEEAEMNRQIGIFNATMAAFAAKWAVERYVYKGKRLLSAQRAKYAASGVQLRGTPLEVMQETASQMVLDITAMRTQGLVEAIRHLSGASRAFAGGMAEARAFAMRAEAAGLAASQASKIGYIRMGTTLLTEGPKILRQFGVEI